MPKKKPTQKEIKHQQHAESKANERRIVSEMQKFLKEDRKEEREWRKLVSNLESLIVKGELPIRSTPDLKLADASMWPTPMEANPDSTAAGDLFDAEFPPLINR